MPFQKLSTHNKEQGEDEVATRDDTKEMSVLSGGVIGVRPALTLPQIAGVRRTTNGHETRMTATTVEKRATSRMTARPGKRDRPCETAEE